MSTSTVFPFRRQLGWIFLPLLTIPISSASGFDQNHRFNRLTLQGGTDSFATHNAFGGAFSSTARQQAQASIDASITNGSLSVLVSFPGLVDLQGMNAASLAVGLANGTPVTLPGNPAAYSGASDLDWWYVFDRAGVDGAGNALQQMPAAITAGVLNAGPGQLTFPNTLFGGNGSFALWSAFLRANVGAASAPLRSTNNFPPGHREPLDPALVSFATLTQGQMRGNISAASLANTPVPSPLTGGGLFACSQNYDANNTFLDLIVGGCSVFFSSLVFATQPDQFDPNAPVLGAGPPYSFTRTGTRVTGARDRLGVAVDLQGALTASAYSSYFTFTTDRVIAFTEPSAPPHLTGTAALANGAVRFRFTNAPRASFSVLSATNVEASATKWTVLGVPTQAMPGFYEFVDPGATNEPRRFYRVRSP